MQMDMHMGMHLLTAPRLEGGVVSEDADVVHDVGLIGLAVYRCGQNTRHLGLG